MLLPPVYRYLPEEFVGRFFETGELRLSSFSLFSKHSDEARGDRDEGKTTVSVQGGGRQLSAFLVGGQQCYVLCGSFILSHSIMSKFSRCNAAIEITNVADFAFEVSRQLAGFTSGLSGYCIYADSRILVRHVESDPFPLPPDPKSGIPIEGIFEAASNAAQDEDLFVKHQKYAYQAEYRLIWNLDKTPLEHITVVAPNARKYCRKVTREQLLPEAVT
jgi:hypothetical protein